MAVNYTVKVKSIAFKEVGAASADAGTSITDIQAGLSITQDDPTTNTIEGELTDVPLMETDTLGKLTVTFDIAGIDPAVAAALSGGTNDTTNKKFIPPSKATQILKKFKIDFEDGFVDMLIHKGKVTCKFDGTDLKTTPLKMNVKIVALVDSATIQGTDLFYEFGQTGVVRTTW